MLAKYDKASKPIRNRHGTMLNDYCLYLEASRLLGPITINISSYFMKTISKSYHIYTPRCSPAHFVTLAITIRHRE